MTANATKTEFGDFQTPPPLAATICDFLAKSGVPPASIIEPTCGQGSLLAAALRSFPNAAAQGFDVNPSYVEQCQRDTASHPKCSVYVGDFFKVDWQSVLTEMPEPILAIGNPPWVTNSTLSSLGSTNLPKKGNFQRHSGCDAITGKSNFDISESMLIHLMERLDGRVATLAMLCKTAVARKVLQNAWKRGLQLRNAEIYRIDAAAHFNAGVDACLLCCDFQPGQRSTDCQVYESVDRSSQSSFFGYHDGRLVANLDTYSHWQHLLGSSSYRWRSGVKHDCSKVMELVESDGGLRNGYGEKVDIEPDLLYPMLKSSELANGRTSNPRRWMLVPQSSVGEETSPLAHIVPKTWRYLLLHAERLDNRGSSIYRKRPRFSVFGVGSYSFSPWKVAISGFYKATVFARLGPHQAKPIVLDDTSYLLPCVSREEAELLTTLLNSDPAREILHSMVFWDSKRPITTELLSTLSLDQLAIELGRADEFQKYANNNPWTTKRAASSQTLLF